MRPAAIGVIGLVFLVLMFTGIIYVRAALAAGEDYLFLIASALILVTVFAGMIYWRIASGSKDGIAEKWLMLIFLFLLAGALTYVSNRMVRDRSKGKRRD
jgi:hypothetical protein